VQIARYLKVGSPDEDLGWGGVSARRLREIYSLLGEVLAEEGPASALEH
jgi:hypothetical protein